MTRVPTFRSLEHTFTLDATDPALCALLHQLFEANATEEPPAQRFAVEVQEGSFAVSVDGNVVLNTKSPSLALAHTVWEINRRAIEQSNRMLVLHAAAAERAGRAVLLPGRSGSGKSTLVATLAAAGFGYLTDDAVAIDRFDGRALANAKPIGLARDVVPLFPLLADLPCELRSYMGDEWYVTPAMLGGTVGSSAVPRLVVFPVYEARATNDATPLSRAETLVMLAESSHNFTRFGADGLDFLAHLLPACACYRFQFSNAESVVDFIAEQLGSVEAAR